MADLDLGSVLELNFGDELSATELDGVILGKLLAVIACLALFGRGGGGRKLGKKWGPQAYELLKLLVSGPGKRLWGKTKPVLPAWATPAAAFKWMRSQCAHFLAHGTVFPGISTGRRRKISKADVQKCLDVVEARAESRKPFHDLDEIANHPTVARVLATPPPGGGKPPSTDTLWRNMHEADPHFKKKLLIEHRRALTQEQMDARHHMSCRWEVLGVKHNAPGVRLVSVPGYDDGKVPLPPCPTKNKEDYDKMWLSARALRHLYADMKSVEIDSTDEYCWTAGKFHPSSLMQPDIRKNDHRNKGKIVFYSAVSPLVGAVYIKFVTGTKGKGYTPEHEYMVKTKRKQQQKRDAADGEGPDAAAEGDEGGRGAAGGGEGGGED
ncbi:hypothetical protein HYH03_018411 [Edaphochlamys debaryana]|uniref:Uncharacterized protein n=1 Tax=Edaphochlamys debaryana TaxID=47281 RepID=A0A835XKC9_9CHLO|nr:hypothetical protein HYH03_018411 [Edaphochlamys debaryana]|eukprot:KAG2482675.1 hypothetical protein HYH03_018411 [Edaphochlamys debaryana]